MLRINLLSLFLKQCLILGLFLLTSQRLSAQMHTRIKGEFSIKMAGKDVKQELMIGSFFYDINEQQIIYRLTFPKNQLLIMDDSTIRIYEQNKLISSQSSTSLGPFSIYHLSLTQQLKNFGLSKTGFSIESVEKKGKMVVTTWKPPKGLEKQLGKVMMANENKQLTGLVYLDADKKVVKKQFFSLYTKIKGVDFPQEMLEITFINGQENYRKTTFKNVQINQTDPGDLYRFR